MTAAPGLQGELVEGRYRIDAPVGSGGFGVVYSAWHLVLERRVAFKVLTLPDTLAPAQRAERFAMFLDEAKVLAKLKHPNIVEALDAGVLRSTRLAAPLPYLVLGWCGRGSLADLLLQRGRLSLADTLGLLRPVVAAVAYAHEAGVAHRDLKPSNILFDEDWASTGPRVIDFGIAKVMMPDEPVSDGGTATASEHRAFTLAYAAPEQIAGARTGSWTDVHALGLLFVHALTGAPPYGQHDPRFAVIDPERPSPARAGVDVGPLEPILARALALRPSDRYRDARALGDAIAAAFGGAVASVPPARAAVAPPLPVAFAFGGQAGGATHVTVPPATRTLQTESAPGPHAADQAALGAPATGRPTRRLALMGIGALGLAGAIGTGIWLGAAERSRKARARSDDDDDEATTGRSASPAAPARRALESLTLEALEALATSAGFEIRSSREDSMQARIVEMVKGSAIDGAAVLALYRFLPAPPLEALGRTLLALRNGGAPHQAYILDGTTALVLRAYAKQNLQPFETMIAGLTYRIRGDTEGGGDPAGEAAGRKVDAWSAKGIADLTADELQSRLRSAGIKVENGPFGDAGPLPLSFAISRGDDRGEIELYRSGGASELAQRKQARKRLAFVRSGDALLAMSGAGSLTSPDVLAQVVNGLPGRAESEPPM